jgi:hypothetical protein
MTPLDIAVNSFFSNAGGVDFLGTIFAIPVVIVIIVFILRSFNV